MAKTTVRPDREYQDENGTYQLPKEQASSPSKSSPEHDRLDAQSKAFIALMNDRPFHAHFSHPKKILDIGCGTGAMTNLLAAAYPTAQVIGIDIAPVPESRHAKLSNVEYIQGDIRELVGKAERFPLGSFDYIFQRLLVFGITGWEKYISSVSGLLKEGGWLECQEVSMAFRSEDDGRVFDGERWYEAFRSEAAELGLDIEIGEKLNKLFEATPEFENVRESMYKLWRVEKEDRPGQEGLEKQSELRGFYAMLLRKIMSARGKDEAYTEELVRQQRERWEKGFEEGDRGRMYVVVGQRK